jgi:hypothetical protein
MDATARAGVAIHARRSVKKIARTWGDRCRRSNKNVPLDENDNNDVVVLAAGGNEARHPHRGARAVRRVRDTDHIFVDHGNVSNINVT